MEDKEKQIKEIETIIKSNLAEGSYASVFARKVAIQIVEHCQLNPSEDSFVLTNDNAEELANLIVTSPQMQSVMGDLIKAWQKETAEKYKVAMMLCIQEMQKYLEITEEQAKILYHHNAEIAKQFDVGVKE